MPEGSITKLRTIIAISMPLYIFPKYS